MTAGARGAAGFLQFISDRDRATFEEQHHEKVRQRRTSNASTQKPAASAMSMPSPSPPSKKRSGGLFGRRRDSEKATCLNTVPQPGQHGNTVPQPGQYGNTVPQPGQHCGSSPQEQPPARGAEHLLKWRAQSFHSAAAVPSLEMRGHAAEATGAETNTSCEDSTRGGGSSTSSTHSPALGNHRDRNCEVAPLNNGGLEGAVDLGMAEKTRSGPEISSLPKRSILRSSSSSPNVSSRLAQRGQEHVAAAGVLGVPGVPGSPLDSKALKGAQGFLDFISESDVQAHQRLLKQRQSLSEVAVGPEGRKKGSSLFRSNRKHGAVKVKDKERDKDRTKEKETRERERAKPMRVSSSKKLPNRLCSSVSPKSSLSLGQINRMPSLDKLNLALSTNDGALLPSPPCVQAAEEADSACTSPCLSPPSYDFHRPVDPAAVVRGGGAQGFLKFIPEDDKAGFLNELIRKRDHAGEQGAAANPLMKAFQSDVRKGGRLANSPGQKPQQRRDSQGTLVARCAKRHGNHEVQVAALGEGSKFVEINLKTISGIPKGNRTFVEICFRNLKWKSCEYKIKDSLRAHTFEHAKAHFRIERVEEPIIFKIYSKSLVKTDMLKSYLYKELRELKCRRATSFFIPLPHGHGTLSGTLTALNFGEKDLLDASTTGTAVDDDLDELVRSIGEPRSLLPTQSTDLYEEEDWESGSDGSDEDAGWGDVADDDVGGAAGGG